MPLTPLSYSRIIQLSPSTWYALILPVMLAGCSVSGGYDTGAFSASLASELSITSSSSFSLMRPLPLLLLFLPVLVCGASSAPTAVRDM